jgi:hypothetical protein
MRAITNTLAMAGVAGALLMGAIAPAAAQTWGWSGNGWNEPYYGRTYGYGGYYGSGYGSASGYYGSGYRQNGVLLEAPVAGRLDPAPYTYGYGTIATPYAPNLGYGQCATDEGYGRFQPCDHGGQ